MSATTLDLMKVEFESVSNLPMFPMFTPDGYIIEIYACMTTRYGDAVWGEHYGMSDCATFWHGMRLLSGDCRFMYSLPHPSRSLIAPYGTTPAVLSREMYIRMYDLNRAL